jgi:hypothetical protein
LWRELEELLIVVSNLVTWIFILKSYKRDQVKGPIYKHFNTL